MPKKGEKHNQETIAKITSRAKGRFAWNKNQKWQNLERKKIGIGKRGILKWIKDKNLYEIIQRDYATAQICEEAGLFKPAIILYAGILEALLRYKIDESKQEEFITLIENALKLELIRQEQANHMQTIRDFRNYVHIYKEKLADLEIINQGIAQLSRQLCDSIINTLKTK